MSVTRELCERIAAVRSKDLDDEILAIGRRLVMDGLAVGVAGAAIEEAPRLLGEYFRDEGGVAQSCVLGQGFSLPAARAALVNGAAMHVLDFEPMWLPSTHALSPALAAAVALAETRPTDGRDLITAVIKGIELQMTLLAARGHVESRDLRFHPPGIVGPLGATVAAAHILGLDAETLARALGIASSRCGGLFSNIGTMTKASHCGYAASFGVEAALLAGRGFTAGTEMFDARKQGYVQAFFEGRLDAQTLLGFGAPFKVIDPGFALKLFPAKFTTHYAINAGLDMHALVPSPEAVEGIEIMAADVPSADRPSPQTGLEGKFSVQYTAAAALLDGEVGLASFTDERLERPDMQRMLGRISLSADPGMSSRYTAGRHLIMTARLRDGTTRVTRCDMPRGAWGTPAPTREQHLAKVRDCLATALSQSGVDRFVEILDRLESAGPETLRDLAGLVRCDQDRGARVPC